MLRRGWWVGVFLMRRRALYPAVLIVLLCRGASAGPKKNKGRANVAERARIERLLGQHAAVLGPAIGVKTLHAILDSDNGRGRAKGVKAWWAWPGRCVRELRRDERVLFREHFGAAGAFALSSGRMVRLRAGDRRTRGSYYLQKALAQPFPLLAEIQNPAGAAAAMRLGSAKIKGRNYHVLAGPPDQQGVRRLVFVDPDSHRVYLVRYEIEENRPFAEVIYPSYSRVKGVLLPSELYATVVLFTEQGGTFRQNKRSIRQHVQRYEINPDVEHAPFVPSGESRRKVVGFERQVLPTGPAPVDVAVGDLDADGRPDVAVSCAGGIAVHFGGSLKRHTFVELGLGSHHGCEIDDMDGDGRLEVLTTSWTRPAHALFVVRFDGARKPEVQRLSAVPDRTYRLRIHDLDRDGIPDIVATGFGMGKPLVIRFGNGVRGVRLTGQDWPLDAGRKHRSGYGLTIGRIDRDILDDIVVVDHQRLLVFQGQSNGAFLPKAPLPLPRPVDVIAVDLDNDGFDDLATISAPPRGGRSRLVIVKNNGKGTLRAGKGVDAGSDARSVAAGHFNADRFPDLVVTSYLDGEVRLYLNNGKGGLGAAQRFASGRGPTRVKVADMNRDGKDDIVVVNRLDDAIAVHLSKRATVRRSSGKPPRARSTGPPDRAEFVLKGLIDTYDFAGSFKLPLSIPDPSGIAFLGGDDVYSQLLVVSDKKAALFRATLDRGGGRLLVGPAIPLAGLVGKTLDLEGVAYDVGYSGNLFLGCEADSTILRATVFGQVFGRAKTGIDSSGNDGIEGVALRRKKDGTPILYVLKERWGTTLKRPYVRAFDIVEEPFTLRSRGKDFFLPVLTPDQTGATFYGESMIATGRLLRQLIEFEFDGDKPKSRVRTASFRKLTDGDLSLTNKNPLFGLIEGVAVDPVRGDLFLVADNNGAVTGRGEHRGREGRVLWFRSRAKGKARVRPGRVAVRQVFVRQPKDPKAREVARALAQEVLAQVRAGEDFAVLMRAHPELGGKIPAHLEVARAGYKLRPGELLSTRIDEIALVRLMFRLKVGETELVEWDPKESPRGWRIVQRIK